MCGILFLHSTNLQEIDTDAVKGNLKTRGPDAHKTISINNKALIEFNRLKIKDSSDHAMQPFQDGSTWSMCNGEIFNWEDLTEKFDLHLKTQCDCEVIIALFKLFIMSGLSPTCATRKICQELDGEFAFVIYHQDEDREFIIAARDPYGVRPLFSGELKDSSGICFASEMKGIHDLCSTLEQFQPGSFMVEIHSKDLGVRTESFMYREPFPTTSTIDDEQVALQAINSSLKSAVKKRLMSDREICCLLSGGLDSSLIAGLVSTHFPPGTLKTYSIGLMGSPDLHHAKMVANHIKSNHTTIELSEKEFLDAIETVIYTIESYDTTSVRASVGNYLVSKYIRENSNCKVVFNGDYADEVCGGYKYFSRCSDAEEFHEECVRLTSDIHYFDSLRSDRCISSNGLEGRVPFADKDFVRTYLSIIPELRMSDKRIEKFLLRKAFDHEDLIPTEVLWRKKEAFSDGVSTMENSWHNIIKRYAEQHLSDVDHQKMKRDTINPAISKETALYKTMFKKFYDFDAIIPYYWLPKFCGEMNGEPSAREI
tara:strand:+ start:1182 stop:2798 length:1617 start_codon:yes stop_codon:yes gene_type:complete